jgi:hypothetical protein
MDKAELLAYCKNLYLTEGIEALSYPKLKQTKGLYWSLYNQGLKQRELLKELGIKEEYNDTKGDFFSREINGVEKFGWSWKRIVEIATQITQEKGFLPPAQWFSENGYGSLVSTLYYRKRTWEDLREAIQSFETSSFVESRNGLRWRSHPEASFSNFLYGRGIHHKRGIKYPEEFSQVAKQNYAYYDLHFLSKSGAWIDVEIWGDKPNGANAEKYAEKRKDKENFNTNNTYFLGVEFKDCYNEKALTKLLFPYIGKISPFIFDKPHDSLLHSTHWSNVDEMLDFCRDLASKQPDGKFPTEEWLRKRGKWKNRDGETYNTLSIYIKNWVGGVRKLRQILGQAELSTKQWSEKTALEEYKKWYDEYGFTAGKARYLYSKGYGNFTKEEYLRATNIVSAIQKYAGGTTKADNWFNIKGYKKPN